MEVSVHLSNPPHSSSLRFVSLFASTLILLMSSLTFGNSIILYLDAGAEGSGGSDEEDGSIDYDSSDSSPTSPPLEPTSYETSEALTTVEIAPLSLSRSPTPEPLLAALADRLPASHVPGPSQTGMTHKKRVRNVSQARPKLSREDKKERAKAGKGGKKKLEGRMKGTKARSAR